MSSCDKCAEEATSQIIAKSPQLRFRLHSCKDHIQIVKSFIDECIADAEKSAGNHDYPDTAILGFGPILDQPLS